MARRKKGSVKETDTLIITNVDLATADVTGVLPVANGGTGSGSYTDGQLLIGNTSGNTLTKATLTAGSNITITNGGGSITIASTGGSSTANVAYATKTDTASTTSTTWADTGLQVTITPTSTDAIVQLTASFMCASTNWAYFRFVDNAGAAVLIGDTSGSKASTQSAGFLSASGVGVYNIAMHAMDAPASTSALTYKLQWRINSSSGGTVYLNRGLSGEADTDNWPRGAAYMIAEEFPQ